MVIKRKRSVSELLSSPTSAPSSFKSPPQNTALHNNPFASINATPLHLHSRTLKRFRDSRPSEDEVHQRTLNMLYSAQNQSQEDSDTMSVPERHQEIAQPETNQQSLHRFWNISSTPAPSASKQPMVQLARSPSTCDDCGAGISGGNNDLMNVDGRSHEGNSCGACGKHVCFSCSVSNLGEQRRCLHCAGRKVRAGGLGWTNPGVPVC
ncbi:hypothetical protein AK830_g616 [Neonectria ditissima]|uniref:Uncharacterized protein n=1 Tax=Neonectria ditissima TaxID=78410 RepID=A0A0P7B794_9HYPO|nr:hypothetical protein AK830_g616 [Neonectria ditissima]